MAGFSFMREKNVGEVKCMASGCRPKFSIIARLIVSLASLNRFSLFKLCFVDDNFEWIQFDLRVIS